MRTATILALVFSCFSSLQVGAWQSGPSDFSWRYYRPTNTGIQGDFCEALKVDSDGNPWIGGYDASFEEGGFSKFRYAENRWENFSNVDYPAIGHPFLEGTSRVSDIEQDELGNLWMATGRGALFYSPALGPSSLVRFSSDNSPIPGGWSRGVELAPDGTVWFSCYATFWGGSGVSQYDPTTDQWRIFDNPFGSGEIAVQPKAGGGYYLWNEATGLEVNRYDSTTDQWQTINSADGGAAQLIGKDATDSAGNTWMLRWTNFSLFQWKLDCIRPDGTWFNFPAPPFGDDVACLHAKAPNLVLVVDGQGRIWRFNGTNWQSLGIWNNTWLSYDVDQDASGNIWVCGAGGAARRDAVTGVWQRYRITNTSQYDFFNEDLSIGKNGEVYATANAGPGYGGMVKFDGQKWIGFNNAHYGLGFDWPFNTDNSQRIHVKRKTGEVFVNPTFDGIYRFAGQAWTDTNFPFASPNTISEDAGGRVLAADFSGVYAFRNNSFRKISNHGAKVLRPDLTTLSRVWAMGETEIHRIPESLNGPVWTVADFPELDTQSDQFKGMVLDPDGMLWIGANTINLPDNSTLIKLNPATGQYTSYRYGANWPFPGQYLMPVCATPDGRIWFQYDSDFGIDDQGLAYFDGTDVVTFPAPFEGVPQWGGLPHAAIRDVEYRKTADGYELWIVCASRGIAVLKVTPASNRSPATGAGATTGHGAATDHGTLSPTAPPTTAR